MGVVLFYVVVVMFGCGVFLGFRVEVIVVVMLMGLVVIMIFVVFW